MPGIDGFEAVPMIRELCPDAAIIMTSSDDRPGDATVCHELGLAGYATKPVRRSELLRLVCQALSVAGERIDGSVLSPFQYNQVALPTRPLQLLIAEDSEDNRFLLDAYLKNEPYQITFAEDGQRAVELFAAQAFDLVLMDLQMPVMDGLTATRMIRLEEQNGQRARTPVVALTANARSEDVQASQAAGCDSHLSKPISKQRLISAIEALKKPLEARQTAPQFIIELPEGLEDYSARYLERRKQELHLLQGLLDQSDFQQIAALAHMIKGNGSSFGFPGLTRLGDALESSAKEENVQRATETLKELSRYVEHAWNLVQSLASNRS